MNIQRGFEDSNVYRGGCVSIGNFDGVHLGHRRMLQALVAQADRLSAPAVVFTFEPHPIRVLAPDRAPPLLTDLDRKLELIAACGVDCTIVYPVTRQLLNLTSREFFDQILIGELQARGMVEGPNFCFGRGRTGTVQTLGNYCRESGIELTVSEAVVIQDQLVSSSAIRAAISEGRVDDAAAMLGAPYRIQGKVTRGAGRGSALGFGTANLAGVSTLLPADGVYAGAATVEGQVYAAAVHLGPNPTFAEGNRKLEVHLIGYGGGDLYGSTLAVDVLQRIRSTMRFSGVDELRAQLEADVARAREIAAQHHSQSQATP